MFFQTQEERSLQNEKKIRELSIQAEALNKEINNFYAELNICPATLAEFSKNKENFSSETWEELQHQRQLLDEKLVIQEQTQTKRHHEDRNIARHWIPVR